MDVTLITNNLSAAKSSFNSSNVNLHTPDAANMVSNSSGQKTDYSEVMMDIEEIQNFLFMLIGSKIPVKSAETDKGNNLNMLI
jgi:hypothetical protein